MNSGCYENDISKTLLSLKAIDKSKLAEIEIKNEDINFLYRGTNLPEDLVIISARLKGHISPKEKIEENQNNLIERKKKKHSQIKLKHAEALKNISQDKKAWTLIKEAECENFKVGDLAISQNI